MHCPTGNCEANADRGTDQLKELKKVQKENEQLRRAVADLTLDKLILTEAAKGTAGPRQRNF